MSTTAHLDVSQFDSRVFTEDLKFIEPEKAERIPTYRVIDTQGNVLKPEHDPNVRARTHTHRSSPGASSDARYSRLLTW